METIQKIRTYYVIFGAREDKIPVTKHNFVCKKLDLILFFLMQF